MAHGLLLAASMKSLVLVALVAGSACGGNSGPGDADVDAGVPAIDDQWLVATGIGALATDAQRLYFVEGRSLRARPLEGGDATTLATLPDPNPQFGGILSLHVGADEVAFVEGLVEGASGTQTQNLWIVPKVGGVPLQLATSMDPRAFLGVSIDGDFVYYSSSTSVLRVPRTGGTSQYVGRSDQTVQYWIFSPEVHDGQLYWAADSRLYRMPVGDSSGKGKPFASLPASSAKIVAHDRAFVVALSPQTDFLDEANAIVEVDPTTGAVGPAVPFGTSVDQVVATAADAWGATLNGVVRVPRTGGAPVQVTTTPGFFIAAGTVPGQGEAVFATTDAGITRLAAP